jgi:acyl-[acyl-carrier-protein]-phospholipid O-acyltransferase/long-chain-fatty-acid--[acyl-carrier-protein] ligase
MPGIEARMEPVAGIAEGGRLHVKGPNIMLGYLRDTAPGVIEPVSDGWYDTGDIIATDADGYISIQGRAKRFAKIAGEMVSLAAVESFATSLSPAFKHAAIARPDERKGERVILLTEDPDLKRPQYAAAAAAAGIAEIMFPRDFIFMEKMPVFPTGKIDYQTVEQLLNAERNERAFT